jgi:FMN phosphatase YigB (HAD superfamily)
LGEQLETQFWTLFDKYLFSYKIGQKKSDPLFRETIQEDEMSLFIDDKQNNLNQAKKYGIPGYLFTSFDVLLQDWNTIWIQITGIPKKS